MIFEAASTLTDQITRFLTDQIVRMELKPGARIIEAKLAEQLGTSKAPVREALRSLEKKRLVKIIPRKGATVTEVSKSQFEWIADVIIELMALVALKCVENGTPEELHMINYFAIQSRQVAEKKDTVGYYNALLGFALACLKAAHNPVLEEVIDDLMPGPLRVIFATLHSRADDLLENVKIVETGNGYIQTRNAEMAEKTVRLWTTNEKKVGLRNIALKKVPSSD